MGSTWVQTGTVPIPVDEGTDWGTTGQQAAATGENTTTTPTKPALGQRVVTLYKAVALTHVTEEMATDTLRAYVRIGLVPLLSAAGAPKLDTGATLSHCVTTATRT